MFRLLKLKPPNGWNAVGWELVIVTVGVLMALALQEWAGKVTSAAQTDEARKALRQELRGHYYNAAEWRRFSPCVTAQLNEIEQRVVTSAARLKRAPLDRADGVVRMAVVAPRRLYDDSAWTGTLQQGTAFQLTASERHTLSNAYWLAQHMERLRGQFDEADTRLLATTRPIELDPQVRQSLIHSIDQVHTANEYMNRSAAEIMHWAQEYGAGATRAEVERDLQQNSIGTTDFCNARNFPLPEIGRALDPNS